MGIVNLINSTLLKSWERSERYKASLDKAKDAILTAHEFKTFKEQNAQFLKRLHPTIEQLAVTLKKTNSIVGLSDETGILLNTLGDPSFLKDTEKIYLQAGAQWSEQIHGTNSAGTVAKEKRALAVIGTDHYLQSHHMLYCVGSPIFNPHGQLKGVLNISGHANMYEPSFLHLVDIISRKIENDLLMDYRDEQIVISLQNNKLSHYEALIAIDLHGQIIGMNRTAREIFPEENQREIAVQLDNYMLNTHQLSSSHTFFNIVNISSNNYVESFIASVVKHTIPQRTYVTSVPSKASRIRKTINDEVSYFTHIIGEDKAFTRALEIAKKVAPTNYHISITGESGTGKDLVSYAIHKASNRKNKPFVALNCGGITKSLAESELFGYEQGAFTGARREGHAGVFERANEGTLFLDEIAELPFEIQASLLRVLQDFKVMRIGGTEAIEVDVRIITATHTDLWEKVESGTFRDDLFYRLQGVRIELPPLRKRTDRLQYAIYFLEDIKKELQVEFLELSSSAKKLITTYQWPGNIRQLKSSLREAAFLATDGLIEMSHFPSYIIHSPEKMITSNSLLQDVENRTIIETIQKTDGNISEAARILGIGRNTLYRKLEQIREQTPFEF